MTKAKVTGIPTTKKPDGEYYNEPAIVKVAMLGLILADKDTDIGEKRLCVMAAMRMGYITREEADQLLLYRAELERFGDHEDEDLPS